MSQRMGRKYIGRGRILSAPDTPSSPQTAIKERFRLVVLGASRVGKTSILSRLLHRDFATVHNATVEDFHQEQCDINGKQVTFDIIDTAGTHRFPAMRELSIRNGDAFVLVYSIDDKESFKEVEELRQLIFDIKAKSSCYKTNNRTYEDTGNAERIPIVVVANKADLNADSIECEQVATESTVCIDWEHGFVKASAKNDLNIECVFREVLKQAGVAYKENVEYRRGSLPEPSMNQVRSKNNKKSGLPRSFSCLVS